jgi:3-phenylpropionate/trans-cinnamate dioxygenase ferredoxin subunit
MADWITIAKVGDLKPGSREVFDIDGYYVAVFNVDGRYYAIADTCTHDGGPLVEGELKGYEIECPRHGARFDIRSGAALSLPAVTPTKRYEVRIEGDEVQIYFGRVD